MKKWHLLTLLCIVPAAVALMSSCRLAKQDEAKNIIARIRDAANEIGRTGKAEFAMKISAAPQYKVVYFYPYTSFDDAELDDSAKRELKEISFSVEKPLFAVVDGGKVSGYCDVKLSLEPAGEMPMVWSSHDGVIRINFRKKPDGTYVLY